MTATSPTLRSYSVDQLPEFLRARVREDERVARAAELHDIEFLGARILDFGAREGDQDIALYLHRFTPSAALATCAARRAIIDRHARVRLGGGVRCHCCWTNDYDRPEWPCLTLKALAMPYADHGDFCEEWTL